MAHGLLRRLCEKRGTRQGWLSTTPPTSQPGRQRHLHCFLRSPVRAWRARSHMSTGKPTASSPPIGPRCFRACQPNLLPSPVSDRGHQPKAADIRRWLLRPCPQTFLRPRLWRKDPALVTRQQRPGLCRATSDVPEDTKDSAGGAAATLVIRSARSVARPAGGATRRSRTPAGR